MAIDELAATVVDQAEIRAVAIVRTNWNRMLSRWIQMRQIMFFATILVPPLMHGVFESSFRDAAIAAAILWPCAMMVVATIDEKRWQSRPASLLIVTNGTLALLTELEYDAEGSPIGYFDSMWWNLDDCLMLPPPGSFAAIAGSYAHPWLVVSKGLPRFIMAVPRTLTRRFLSQNIEINVAIQDIEITFREWPASTGRPSQSSHPVGLGLFPRYLNGEGG